MSHTDDLRGPREEVKKMAWVRNPEGMRIIFWMFPSRLMRWHMVLQG